MRVIKAHLPKARYFRLRKHLRTYKMENDLPGKGVGWKVERAVDEVNRVFRSTMDCPSRDISIDEGMGAASSSFNPCFTRIENKPLEGIRFFIAVDFVSKCSAGIIADL